MRLPSLPPCWCIQNNFQVEGLQRKLPGCMDKSPPKGTLWKILPYRLFFGHEFSRSWGPGGVAFLNSEANIQEKTYMPLYRITYVIRPSLWFCPFYLTVESQFHWDLIFYPNIAFLDCIFFFALICNFVSLSIRLFYQARAVQRCIGTRKWSQCHHQFSFVRFDGLELNDDWKVWFSGD